MHLNNNKNNEHKKPGIRVKILKPSRIYSGYRRTHKTRISSDKPYEHPPCRLNAFLGEDRR